MRRRRLLDGSIRLKLSPVWRRLLLNGSIRLKSSRIWRHQLWNGSNSIKISDKRRAPFSARHSSSIIRKILPPTDLSRHFEIKNHDNLTTYSPGVPFISLNQEKQTTRSPGVPF